MNYYKAYLTNHDSYYETAARKYDFSADKNKHNLVYIVNREIARIANMEGCHIYISSISDTEAEILAMNEPKTVQTGTLANMVNKVVSFVWEKSGSAELEEIPVKEFSEKLEAACTDGNFSFSYRMQGRSYGWEYFDNCMFKLKEEICDFAKLGKGKALKKAGDLLADSTLTDEIERIFDKRNPGRFLGHPVHYVVKGSSDSSGAVIQLLAESLFSRGRIQSKRINKLTEIEEGCYDEHDVENAMKNATGGTIVIDTSGRDDKEGKYASVYQQVVDYFCKLIQKYSKDVLFIFVENPNRPGFTKKMISSVTEYIDLIEIKDGCGNREQAKRYFEIIRKKSEFAEFEAPVPENLFAEEREYKVSEIHKIYNKWAAGYLRRYVYKAYAECTVARSGKSVHGKAYEELSSLIGLDEVKKMTKRIVASAVVDERRRNAGQKKSISSRHMIFTGNPGSCKTTVARILARTLKEEGVLETGDFVECGRADLIGKYVGWTDKIIREKFREAHGGILFIDEAYSLVEEGGHYGDEAINTIVQEMENQRDDVIVIFAGYPEKMEQFLSKNEGLRSRIAFHMEFPDYSQEELAEIFEQMLKNNRYEAAPEAIELARGYFRKAADTLESGNGRFVRNLFEQAVMKQSLRLYETYHDTAIPEKELFLLTAEDLKDMRFFMEEKKRRIGFGV